MKLSIITVNLNNCDGLQKTIDSVVAQTFKDFEWIVIDGGSTDGSRELIEQYSEHFAYWVSEPDKGIYNAMNKGIKVARGEYLQFLNSGDWLCDDQVLSSVFANPVNDDVVYGNYGLWSEKDNDFYVENVPDELSISFLVDHWIGHGASFMRRELFKDKLYDERLRIVSDWKFFIECALNNKSFRRCDLVVMKFGKDGISVVEQDRVAKERAAVKDEIVPRLLRNDLQKMDEYESDVKMMELRQFKKKNKFYRRIIHFTLRVIKFLDSFHSGKS